MGKTKCLILLGKEVICALVKYMTRMWFLLIPVTVSLRVQQKEDSTLKPSNLVMWALYELGGRISCGLF